MSDTTARALALLNLLQTHRHGTGPELAERLGVSERTVRRDVERLRDLGYRIESVPGLAGGYRLERGGVVPPLLLTDEEAVAMAAGLRLAATRQLTDGTETTIRALAKLERVLPAALRERVNALAAAVRPAGTGPGSGVSPAVLTALARAVRAALVPALLGPRPPRLAHVPHRPDRRRPPHRGVLRAEAAVTAAGRGVPRRSQVMGQGGVRRDGDDRPADRPAAPPVRRVGPGRRARGRRHHPLAGRRRRLPGDHVRPVMDPARRPVQRRPPRPRPHGAARDAGTDAARP